MQDIRSMDVLETLSVALGLATLAGINLYLTVFVTGMAVQFGWVLLPSHLHDLSVLGDSARQRRSATARPSSTSSMVPDMVRMSVLTSEAVKTELVSAIL